MSRFSLPSQRPAVHSVTPHEALRGTGGHSDTQRDTFQTQNAELIIFLTPAGTRVVNPAISETQALRNAALERAVAPQLRDLRRAVTRLGTGR